MAYRRNAGNISIDTGIEGTKLYYKRDLVIDFCLSSIVFNDCELIPKIVLNCVTVARQKGYLSGITVINKRGTL